MLGHGAIQSVQLRRSLCSRLLEPCRKARSRRIPPLRSPISVAHVVQSLWGLLEWYAQEQGSEAKCYYPLLPELEWIRDIAYSAKHRALGRKLTTKHMGYPNTGALAYGAGGYGVGPGGYSNSEPVVILDDGTTHKLIDLIPKIEAFWQARFPDGKD